MKQEEKLLISLKQVRAERVRLLSLQDKSQLIKLIERLGHFKYADEDIEWLENLLISKKEGN